MKKVYINGRFLAQEITGVQRYAREITKGIDILLSNGEIDADDWKFTLLVPSSTDSKTLGHFPLKNIETVPIGHFDGHFWEQAELPFFSSDGVLFCPGNTAPVLSLLGKKSVVVTVHDLSYLDFPDAYSLQFRILYGFLMPLVLSAAQVLITVSESEKKAILRRYPKLRDRLVPIPNGVVEDDRAPDKSSNPRSCDVLYVGSLSRRKNFQGVAKALEIVRQKITTRLVVIGATGRTFTKVNITLPPEAIAYKGQVNSFEELAAAYRSAGCFVFPSFYESSGLPPLEAMACGCPVIASNIPALRERCGEAAIYCDPNSPDDIAEKIIRVLTDKDLAVRMQKAGYIQAANFSWLGCARATVSLLEQVCTLRLSGMAG